MKFRIENLAQTGMPFHLQQAELLKYVIDKYDVFLIYAGHNEAENYYDESGFYRDEEHKNKKVMKPFAAGKFDLAEWLRTHIHVSAITEKAQHKYVDPISEKLKNKSFKPQLGTGNFKMGYWPDRPKLYEAEKVVPDDELTNIFDNFEADVRQIGRLADEKGKIVIISSVPSHGEYGPAFSVHKAGLTDEDLREFDEAYSRGLDRYNRGDFQGAVDAFLVAAEIDEQAAFLNYMLGLSYSKLGDVTRGRLHIQRSIDYDGLYNRASSTLANISESVAGGYASVHYVDTVRRFSQVLDSGITNDELFSDFQHPSFMGHLLLARNFLSKMSELEPLVSLSREGNTPEIDLAELRSLTSYYSGLVLHVPQWGVKRLTFNRARWHLSQSRWSSDPTELLEHGAKAMREYYALSDKTPEDEAFMLMFLALIKVHGSDNGQTISLVNWSIQISQGLVQDFLYGRVYVDGMRLTGGWISEFNRLGLNFWDTQKGLILTESK